MKKILINYYSFGNMDFLMKYYDENLKDEYKGKIKLINTKDIKDDNKAIKNLKKFFLALNSYDMVISDYPTKLFKLGKKSMYISHGYGTKMTPGKDEVSDTIKLKNYKDLVENLNYVVTMAKRDEDYFLKNENLEDINNIEYIPLGIPRNDVLFDEDYIEKKNYAIKRKLNLRKKVIMYSPTWRGYKSNVKFPFNRDDFKVLNNFLEDNGYTLIYRPHPLEKLFDDGLISGLKNIICVDGKVFKNTQDLLCVTDILITDYSSIYVDYLALNRPVAFIAYDIEEYQDFRGLVISFKNKRETPGPKLLNIGDLICYIKDIEKHKDEFKSFREEARDIFFHYKDNFSAERIWDFLLKELKI